MRKWQVFICVISFMTGCTDRENIREEWPVYKADGQSEVVIKAEEELYIDSAQVFFFRPSGLRDTLILREVIHGISPYKATTFRFDLPAGKYDVYIFGNVPDERIIASPPYAPGNIYFDYADGQQTNAVYLGRTVVNVGVDTLKLSGLILVSSSVELTIRQIPVGVEKIVVRLMDTSSGLFLTGGYMQKPPRLPVSDTLTGIKKDSTYVVRLYGFPPLNDKKNTLEVYCYGGNGEILYAGTSSPFEARPGENSRLSCHFKPGGVKAVLTADHHRLSPGNICFNQEKK